MPNPDPRTPIFTPRRVGYWQYVSKEKVHEMMYENYERGNLIKWKLPEPFPAREVFIVEDVPAGTTRGGHAHRTCTQILILLSGELEVSLEDKNGISKHSLRKNCEAIVINPLTWGTQRYLTDDTRLLVLCSEEFDESEYIRDYKEFKNVIQTKEVKKF